MNCNISYVSPIEYIRVYFKCTFTIEYSLFLEVLKIVGISLYIHSTQSRYNGLFDALNGVDETKYPSYDQYGGLDDMLFRRSYLLLDGLKGIGYINLCLTSLERSTSKFRACEKRIERSLTG